MALVYTVCEVELARAHRSLASAELESAVGTTPRFHSTIADVPFWVKVVDDDYCRMSGEQQGKLRQMNGGPANPKPGAPASSITSSIATIGMPGGHTSTFARSFWKCPPKNSFRSRQSSGLVRRRSSRRWCPSTISSLITTRFTSAPMVRSRSAAIMSSICFNCSSRSTCDRSQLFPVMDPHGLYVDATVVDLWERSA